MRAKHKVLILLALLSCGIPCAVANSRATFDYNVAPDFIVRATLGMNPLAGSEVRIEPPLGSPERATVIASAITDSQGEATFSHVRPGKYFLSVRHAGMQHGESGDLIVIADHSSASAQRVVSFSWSAAGFESTQHLAGWFSMANSLLPKAQTTAVRGSITVIEFTASKVVAEGSIDDNGHFDFAKVDEGYFIVEITGDPKMWPASWPTAVDLLVHIDRQAKRPYLSASMSLTDAGIAFVFMDENK